MAQQENLNVVMTGLSTFPNQLSQVPQSPSIGLVVAQNIVIDKEGIINSRRGVEIFAEASSTALATYYDSFTEYANNVFAHTDTNELVYTPNATTAWTALSGTYNPPGLTPASRVRFFQNNSNLYWLTDNGSMKLDAIGNNVLPAGAPAGLDGTAALDAATTGGFMNANSQIAYRVVWSYYDANNNFVQGAPSDRIIVSNATFGSQTINFGGTVTSGGATGLSNSATKYNCSISIDGGTPITVQITGSTAQTFSALITAFETAATGCTMAIVGGNLVVTSNDNNLGSAINIVDGPSPNLFGTLTGFVAILSPTQATKNVDVTFQVPIGVDTTWTYTVYRSNQSASATTEPDDECQEVYTGQLSSGQLSARLVSFTDTTPDDLRGTTLYTSPSQLGIVFSNLQPPLANDVEEYRGFTFYANIQTLYTLTFTLVNVGSPTGLQVGDTVSIYQNGTLQFTLTGAASEVTSTGHFLVQASLDPATNIQQTAQSLTRVMNLYASNTIVNAFYVSDADQLPGQCSIEGRELTTGQFYMVCSRTGNVFNPAMPSSGSTQNNTAINDTKPNRIVVSQYLQPEACTASAPGYQIDVGTPNEPIVRLMATKDVLFIFKGGQEGIFYIRGTSPPFTLLPFDQTVHIVAENSPALLNNSIWFFSDQGIVSVSDSGGTEIQSRPIESDLLTLATSNYPDFNTTCWAMSYASDRKYILGVQTNPGDTYTTQMYVKNYLTDQWTNWQRTFNLGFIRQSDDHAYFSNPNALGGQLMIERKEINFTDYSDEQYTVDITSVNGNIVTFSSMDNIVVGQVLTQGSLEGQIEFIDVNSNITIAPDTAGQSVFSTGTATITVPINLLWITHPIHCGIPNIVKQFSEFSLDLGNSTYTDFTISFVSDMTLTSLNANTVLTIPPLLTQATWGDFPWGSIPWGLNNFNLNQRIRNSFPLAYQKANWLQMVFAMEETIGSIDLQGIEVIYTPLSPAQH